MSPPGFWDYEERLRRLSDLDDQLEGFSRVIDLEVFRADLEAALSRSDGTKSGRPPYDSVLMFKVLIVQTINNPGLFVRTIGIARAYTKIGFANLACNMRRFLWLAARSAPG